MARKRFSDLETVYDALKQGGVNIDSLPQNLAYAKYAKWKEGDAPDAEITRPSLGAAVQLGVIAFGLAFTEASAKIKVTSNARATGKVSDIGVLKTAVGYKDDALTDYSTNGSFIPALCRVAENLENAKQETSRITGRKYTPRTGKSYTVPMGQGGSARGYKKAIDDILNTSTASTHKFSFSPEEWRRD